jgi:hypothetical protein
VSSRSLAWRNGDAGATAARPPKDSNFTYNRGDGDSIEDRFGLQLKTRIFRLPLVLVQALAVLPSASDARGQARSVVPWDIGALALAASVESSDCLAGSTGKCNSNGAQPYRSNIHHTIIRDCIALVSLFTASP